MMKINSGKVAGVIITIVLLVVLLLILVIAGVETQKKRNLVSQTTALRKELMLKPEIELPQIEDIEAEGLLGEEPLPEEKEKRGREAFQEVGGLEDLPLEKVSSEKRKLPEEISSKEEEVLEIQPDWEEIEELKRRGLIIY